MTVNTVVWPFYCPQVGILSAGCLKTFLPWFTLLRLYLPFCQHKHFLYEYGYTYPYVRWPNTTQKQPLMTSVTHLGALTKPSFRNAQHPSSRRSGFYMHLSNLAPEKSGGIQKDDSFLINRTAVLYSSPITGSSGPFAMTYFLQQADDEMS